jgi:hypothetical protein
LQINSDVRTTRADNISDKFQKTVNNKTPEHRIEEAPKALFWKSALIMTSRYPRERAEVDRKKRRAADTTISISMYLQFTIDFQTNMTCSKSFHIS